jgi:hypothetical protein
MNFEFRSKAKIKILKYHLKLKLKLLFKENELTDRDVHDIVFMYIARGE